MKIIGIGHYSRTGKDTLANAIIDTLAVIAPHIKARKLPFAWKLKEVAYDLYAWDGMQPPAFYDTPEGEKLRNVKLPTVGKTPVEIWIDLGTPAVRDAVYDRTWIDYVFQTDWQVDVLIIPDVRFLNEIREIEVRDGWTIKVVRPGHAPRNSKADRELLDYDGWDYIVGGTGKMEELLHWGSRIGRLLLAHTPTLFQCAEEREANLRVEQEALRAADSAKEGAA